MLPIEIAKKELWDNEREEFLYIEATTLRLEHSLVSIREWESKWHKPFLSDQEKTYEETLDYIRCMSLEPISDPNIVYGLSQEQVDKIIEYINEKMTASWINSKREETTHRNQNPTTSEVIYAMMFELGIPIECQNWHFNHLIMQIQVSAERQKPPKKKSKAELTQEYKEINARRRAEYEAMKNAKQ